MIQRLTPHVSLSQLLNIEHMTLASRGNTSRVRVRLQTAYNDYSTTFDTRTMKSVPVN